MTNDIKNPEYCTIRRVENGWIIGSREGLSFGCEPSVQHVFLTPRQLAAFIEDNFRLPRPTQEEGK